MKILFYPDNLRHHSKLRYVFEYFNIEWTNDIEDNWDIAIFWDYRTIRESPIELDKFNRKIINYNCITADKKHVDRIFKLVFRYTANVDPNYFQGFCIEKSINQAAHDGKIIECPINSRDGYVYQKIIDTRINENYIRDIRVSIFKNEVGCVFEKIRSVKRLYGGLNRNGNKVIYHKNANDLLSKHEQENLIEFCNLIPVEYCELDVLRNNWDSKIYVVDMNNTPSGGLFITMGLDNEETKSAIKNYSEIFYEKFLK